MDNSVLIDVNTNEAQEHKSKLNKKLGSLFVFFLAVTLIVLVFVAPQSSSQSSHSKSEDSEVDAKGSALFIKWDNPNIYWNGRRHEDGFTDSMMLQFPGGSFQFGFKGTDVTLFMNDDKANHFDVICDTDNDNIQSYLSNFLTTSERHEYHIVEGLDPVVDHWCMINKRTGWNQGPLNIYGFMLGNKDLQSETEIFEHAPDGQLKIEIWGDEMSSGFCTEGQQTVEVDPVWHNSRLSWGGALGLEYDAEVEINAVNAAGLVRNREDSEMSACPYPCKYPFDVFQNFEIKSFHNFEDAPDAVFSLLGMNDYFGAEEDWAEDRTVVMQYSLLVNNALFLYPEETPIFLMCGLFDSPTNEHHCDITLDVAEGTNSSGRVYFVNLENVLDDPLNDFGCGGGTSQVGSKKIAAALQPYIDDVLGWEKSDNADNSANTNDDSVIDWSE